MIIHILPGDSLRDPFRETGLEGTVVICRECLITGDVEAENLDEFWQVREDYLTAAHPKPSGFYREKVKSEFEKLLDLPEKSEVNLWFEYELFCQVNMWFCLDLLKDSKAEFYRIAPVVKSEQDVWKGFGALDPEDLEKSWTGRKRFDSAEIRLGSDLWKAFQNKDFETLEKLSCISSDCFPLLKEVCRAAIEKETRPKRTLEKIIAAGEKEFGRVFRLFNETEGIYGFGDLQVKQIYDEII